jgi:hypothetical protein
LSLSARDAAGEVPGRRLGAAGAGLNTTAVSSLKEPLKDPLEERRPEARSARVVRSNATVLADRSEVDESRRWDDVDESVECRLDDVDVSKDPSQTGSKS